MGERSAVQIDAWLRGGGLVVTASERSARFLTAVYHRARRAEGLTAWTSPNIQDWQTFVRKAWDARILDSRVVLNALPEQSIWADIVARRAPEAAQLEGAHHRLTNLAMQAHRLLCDYAPQLLNERERIAWSQDAAAFSAWLTDFDEICRDANLVSLARLSLELIDTLKADSTQRPPLLLAGFDRILPTQRLVFDAWKTSDVAPIGETQARIDFHVAADPASELEACALWCRHLLARQPHARLIVVAQDVPKRRGEIERAFLRHASASQGAPALSNLFEFSLGVPLGQIALARGAGLLLHWLDGPIDEHELDWLLSADQLASNPEESRALIGFMRELRRRNLQRTRWSLTDFSRQQPGKSLPQMWKDRLTRAQLHMRDAVRQKQSPLAWSELVPRLLELAGWPGSRPLSSVEFQVLRRWQQTVDDCASLDFNGRPIEWRKFLAALDRAVAETLFAPESEDAPILIAGPAETAGLAADGIWFLGTTEDAWPATGATHPLLPLAVQRQAGMPHASAQLDWQFAAAMTRRLIASAPEVHFSYSRQIDGVDSRPSRLALQFAGTPQPLTAELEVPPIPEPLTIDFQDETQLAFPPGDAPGGAATITAQSQCPFKAFATARLAAQSWDPAEAGLTASERGLLLHAALHSVWAGPPAGIRSYAELIQKNDQLESFVADHVRRTFSPSLPPRARQCMPPRYLALEETRLIHLVTEWLRYESARIPFIVLDTEQNTRASIVGLSLGLRLDRIDQLIDGSLLVIDYKSSDVSPSSWDLPRLDDVQLPLYANFALNFPPEQIGGLVFAKVRPGKVAFAGLVRDAKTTLRGDLRGNTNLVRNPLTSEQLSAWKEYIRGLARDFLAGRVPVEPRSYPGTCEHCGLQALCRIQENPPQSENENCREPGDA